MNKITNKAKNLAYYAVGSTALLLPTFASAGSTTAAGTNNCIASGDAGGDMAGCVKGVFSQILTSSNIKAIGGLMTFVGLAIVFWKIIEIIFKGEPAKKALSMLIGGAVVAILGTKLKDILETMGLTVT